ncbi:MAG: class I SAM-dependent methyltransferase [Pseudonocardiaceae bacterium]
MSYIDRTGSLELFPGLQTELDSFNKRADRSGPLLDLGCGVGRDSEYLSAAARTVIAADISVEMLKITRARCGVAVVEADMGHLPFSNDTFAGAWVCASLLHIPSCLMRGALGELYRTVRPGGAVAISMKAGEGEGWYWGNSLSSPRWFTFVEPATFGAILADEGFTGVSTIFSGRGDWYVAEATKPT